MADDLKISFRDVGSRKTETENDFVEKVEKAYDDFRDFGFEAVDDQNDFNFDIGVEDWGI